MKISKYMLLIALCCWLASCVSHQNQKYQARVVADYKGKQARVYSHIQAAIDAAPAGLTSPYKIYISPGDYYEKITISKPYIQLIGAGMEQTRIFFDAYAGQEYAPGSTWGTRGSGSVIVRASNIELHNLTIENSFDFLTNDALANEHPQKIRDTQAVALHLDAASDRVIVRNVKLLGCQDTLFVNAGRSWFDQVIVAGNVDFIFGAGNALFTDSEIMTLARGKESMPHGYITAPSTHITREFGLTFINCRLTRAAGVPDNSTPLGRPWQPTTQFTDGRYADPNAIGKAVFINTEMDAHITYDGWYSMNGTAKDGTKVPFPPEKARFFEYQSFGAGAKINKSRRQLSDDEERKYSRENILGDWKLN